MRKITLAIVSLLSVHLYADDLTDIYNLAAQNNATYQAAEATYKAASYGIPIARAAVLPSLVLTANTTGARQSPTPPTSYNSNQYELALTQPLLNVTAWYAYSEAEATYKQAAITYAEALQTLITTVASDYFGVLEAQDQLKYAQANQDSLAEQLKQTEVQYKVGLKALTDVQATQAQYEQAIATTVADQNNLNNANETLAATIGQAAPPLAPLRQDFPLIKPNPQSSDAWVNYGLQNNLALQYAEFQSEIARLQIKVDATNGYVPTIDALGTYTNSKDNDAVPAPTERSTTSAAALELNWNVFNGGSTYATVKQDEYTHQGDTANEEQTRRNTISSVNQAYLNVLSDISQIEAYQQAVISGEASLRAIRAGYLVGTRTIVDVLNQQSSVFQTQQQYAQAIYNYVNDSLNLKLQAGNLSPTDITAVNGWLAPKSQAQSKITASKKDTAAASNTSFSGTMSTYEPSVSANS